MKKIILFILIAIAIIKVNADSPLLTTESLLVPITKTERVLRIYVYLSNTSNNIINIAIPCQESSRSYTQIGYYISVEKTGAGIDLKPSPKDLNLIELAHGETAQLGIVDVKIQDAAQLNQEITYRVSDKLKKFYPNLWTGIISCMTNHPGEAGTRESRTPQAETLDVTATATRTTTPNTNGK